MSGSGPTVSVVIPAHQAAPFLGEAIDSVLAQDRAATEVVVVDDGSTDATSEVARSFGDRVRLVGHAENRGEAAARNTGLSVAGGEVVVMHDADDRMLPHRLRVEVGLLVDRGPATGCVLARTRAFADDGRGLPPWAGADDDPYGNALVTAWRSTYARVGGYDESFATGTDVDWLVRVRAAGLDVGLIDQVLTERRVHDGNLSQLHPDGHRAYTVALRKVLAERRGTG